MRKRSLAAFAAAGLLLLPAAAQEAFTPGPANDPQTCKELWEDIGLPEYARPHQQDALTVCHERYVLSHNNETKTPDWVLERLTRAQVSGTVTRPKMSFVREKNVPKDKAARDEDYTKSRFDRGHQAPSEDFNAKLEWMEESFILSNVLPQQGRGFNQAIWKDLEKRVRDVAKARGTVYVITGPVYRDVNGKAPTITKQINRCGNEIKLQSPDARREICEANNQNPNVKCSNGVAVPVGLFKIIYAPNWPRANAFILPNINHTEAKESSTPTEYLKRFQVTVHAVERFTGLEFFSELPAAKRKKLTLECNQTVLR